MIDLTPIITAVIAIIVALITYRLVPWIKAHTNETQQNILFSKPRYWLKRQNNCMVLVMAEPNWSMS